MVVGIDLGTTYSLIAYWDGMKVVVIPNVFGENLTPSVVSVNEDDEVLVGKAAKERLLSHPNMTASAFKRHMGTSKTYRLGKYTFTPTELSSFVLQSLIEDAKAYLKQEISEAIISVPAYFNDLQRTETKMAAQLAGITVKKIINEPTAAAISYGLLNDKDEMTFITLDLGGGTFDCSLLELFNGVVEIKAVSGDNFLGGEDFTENLMKHFKKRFTLTDLTPAQYAMLYKASERCKCDINNKGMGTVRLSFQGKELELAIAQEEFAEICAPLVARLKAPIERIIRDSGIEINELDSVILVGGSSRLAVFRNLVTRAFGRFPMVKVNVDEAIVEGCAIAASMVEGEKRFSENIIIDICPYSLGVGTCVEMPDGSYSDGIYFSPIIHRNNVLPVSKVQRFSPIEDNQSTLHFTIYQGENRLVADNIKIGEAEIRIPSNPKGRESVDVRFTYNAEGILEVEFTVTSTQMKKTLVLQNRGTIEPQLLEQRLREFEKIKIHPRDKQENMYVLERANRILKETKGYHRVMLESMLVEMDYAIAQQDDPEIAKLRVKISESLDNIEENLYHIDNDNRPDD
jgi:molecular chaperone HscC